jgi:hypothetical protein
MDALSTTATAVKAAGLLDKVVSTWRRWRAGSIKITGPGNREVSSVQPWISVKGTHMKVIGKFWLLTHNGDSYWPQNRITLEHDGRWTSRVNGNTKKENRECSIVLASVGDFADAVFEDYKVRGGKTGNWDPIRLPTRNRELTIVDEVIITILGSDHGGGPN